MGFSRNVSRHYSHDTKSFDASKDWSVALNTGRWSELLCRFAITLTAGAAVTLDKLWCIMNVLSPGGFKFYRGAKTIIDISPQALYMISAARAPRAQAHDVLDATGETGAAEFRIPIQPWKWTDPGYFALPGYSQEVRMSGKFGALTDYSTDADLTAIAGDLTANGIEKPSNSAVMMPVIYSRKDTVNSSTDKFTLPRFDFDEDFYLESIHIISKDKALSGQSQLVRGLWTKFTGKIEAPQGTIFEADGRYIEMEQQTLDFYETEIADRLDGFVVIDARDPEGKFGLRLIPGGSKWQCYLNTSATVDREITDVTPDNDCEVETVIMGYQPVAD